MPLCKNEDKTSFQSFSDNSRCFLDIDANRTPSASYEEIIQRVLELSKEDIDIESDLAKSIIKQGISADVSILQLRMKVLFGASLLIVFGIVGIRK